MNPFHRRSAEVLGRADAEECPEFIRASHLCVCDQCGKEYWRHPFHPYKDFNGDPWLHVLCSGKVVKL